MTLTIERDGRSLDVTVRPARCPCRACPRGPIPDATRSPGDRPRRLPFPPDPPGRNDRRHRIETRRPRSPPPRSDSAPTRGGGESTRLSARDALFAARAMSGPFTRWPCRHGRSIRDSTILHAFDASSTRMVKPHESPHPRRGRPGIQSQSPPQDPRSRRVRGRDRRRRPHRPGRSCGRASTTW